MKFFLDNCMSPHHASGIRAFAEAQRIEIQHLRSKFNPAMKDVEWITTLGQEGDWIVISGDLRITKNPAERTAWIESGMTAFFFADNWSNDSYWKQAADLVSWWPSIVLKAHENPSCHGFVIRKKAKDFQQIFPK